MKLNLKLKTIKKTILYLLVVSFLLQSCYTYKATSIKETPLLVGENYKIREADKFVKSNLKSANDSIITVMEGNVEKDIYVANIKEIKVEKFSLMKTLLYSLGIPLVILGILLAVDSAGGFY